MTTFKWLRKVFRNHWNINIMPWMVIENLLQWRIQDFPEGGREPSRGGREHAKFSRKLHEIERIWTPRGGRASLTPPLDPPMFCNHRKPLTETETDKDSRRFRNHLNLQCSDNGLHGNKICFRIW